mgnify:FL=1
MKNLTMRAIVLTIAFCAALATGVCAFVYLRFVKDEEPPVAAKTAAYTLGVFDGKLAVFEGDSRFPMKLYDVAIAALPQDEQARLSAGIPVSDAGALERLLEDYTS